ncbi:ATP-grasp domain-containing protein [Candidatus Saccharibacteria bacterium]|nr:MAG: ATP-grasp domain-containing protein [Candidatus Saccharibacteria bacterium]
MAVSITTQLVLDAARKRGWKVELYPIKSGLSAIILPDGREYFLKGLRSYKSGAVNTFIADNKDLAQLLVTEMGIQIPDSQLFQADLQAAEAFLQKHGFVVVKPLNSAHGLGVTVSIDTVSKLRRAISNAQRYSRVVMLQQHITGDDYRVLVIDHHIVAAAIRKPAYVIGDGMHTIEQLIRRENANDKRGPGYNKQLCYVDMQAAKQFLGQNLVSIPAHGEEVRVMGVANIGRGGVSIDKTDTLNAYMTKDAIRLTQRLRLGVCGVDFIVAEDGKHYFIEMNSQPSLGLHSYPYTGQSRDVANKFLDWLVKDA